MKKREEADRILSPIEDHRGFWVNEGPVINSLEEFARGVKQMSREQFTHHVNSERNDFVTWINEVLGDSVLAERIAGMKSKHSVAKTAKQRVVHLKKHVK